jgi:hypothetical protein
MQHWPTVKTDNAFQSSYSMYSFFLLNVTATVEAGLLYPPRPIWEDIEFLHMVDEAGLVVLKSAHFTHDKVHKKSKRAQHQDPLEAWLAKQKVELEVTQLADTDYEGYSASSEEYTEWVQLVSETVLRAAGNGRKGPHAEMRLFRLHAQPGFLRTSDELSNQIVRHMDGVACVIIRRADLTDYLWPATIDKTEVGLHWIVKVGRIPTRTPAHFHALSIACTMQICQRSYHLPTQPRTRKPWA